MGIFDYMEEKVEGANMYFVNDEETIKLLYSLENLGVLNYTLLSTLSGYTVIIFDW